MQRLEEAGARLVVEEGPWADPRALKSHLAGVTNVQLHP